LALREEETERLRTRNAQLEADLKREEQRHTVALKENIALKQRLERTASKRR
jgi:type II secretory pathway component PulJ